MTPEYIIENWTDEEFALLIESLNKRKQREVEQFKTSDEDTMVSDKELFKELGNKIKVGG